MVSPDYAEFWRGLYSYVCASWSRNLRTVSRNTCTNLNHNFRIKEIRAYYIKSIQFRQNYDLNIFSSSYISVWWHFCGAIFVLETSLTTVSHTHSVTVSKWLWHYITISKRHLVKMSPPVLLRTAASAQAENGQEIKWSIWMPSPHYVNFIWIFWTPRKQDSEQCFVLNIAPKRLLKVPVGLQTLIEEAPLPCENVHIARKLGHQGILRWMQQMNKQPFACNLPLCYFMTVE